MAVLFIAGNPMLIPSTLTAGDSTQWIDYPFADNIGNPVDATAYSLTYSLRGPISGASLDLAGTASGTGWTFALTTVQTAALNTGATANKWYWQAYAAKSGVRLTAGDGVLVVRPNLASISGTAYDGSSDAEQILATIEAAIKARMSGDAITEYTIGSRSLKKEPTTALLTMRDRYRLIVSRQRTAQMIKNGLGNPTRLGVRFKA